MREKQNYFLLLQAEVEQVRETVAKLSQDLKQAYKKVSEQDLTLAQ